MLGQDLKAAFAAAVLKLEQRRDAINALNVFPVPDGDTGTNMLLTMRAALENVAETTEITIDDLFAGLSQGAFRGARGNSGVIFSQFLAGMAEAVAVKGVGSATSGGGLSGESLERAFRLGAGAAYRSVGIPVEGTMLTVLQSLAPAVAHRMERGESDPLTLWEAAYSASTEALAKTPSQLPVLRDAGVVDAGGMGVVVILGGVLEHLTGQLHLDPLPAGSKPSLRSPGVNDRGANQRVDQNHLDDSLTTEWGYCIQFLIESQTGQAQAGEMDQPLDPEEIRRHLTSTQTGSAVVAGAGDAVRVHVHAANPAPVLSYASSLGALHQITVDSMDHQNRRFVTEQGGETALKAGAADVAVIAVVSGDGLSGLFLETGCAGVVSGGQTMNPSVQELLDSARALGAKHTILLPNNPNVVSAARQAAAGDSRIHVVASRSVPQGVAAILAFLPDLGLEENLESMEAAFSSVRSIEVTQAVRSAVIGGLRVETGQYVALLDNQISTVDATPEGALRQALDSAGLIIGGLVTVYVGADGGWRRAEDLANSLQEEVEDIQVDVVYGGQPHYHYLASVE